MIVSNNRWDNVNGIEPTFRLFLHLVQIIINKSHSMGGKQSAEGDSITFETILAETSLSNVNLKFLLREVHHRATTRFDKSRNLHQSKDKHFNDKLPVFLIKIK